MPAPRVPTQRFEELARDPQSAPGLGLPTANGDDEARQTGKPMGAREHARPQSPGEAPG